MRKQRSGTFKKGHKKLGGRKKGTPNRVDRNLVEAILKAPDRVGSDGKGKDGIDGYFQRLAGKKEGYYVSLLRPAVQKQLTATEPEDEVVYATEQEFRQALLDGGVHPTLLPPPPRDFNEKPPAIGQLVPPKPPPGWEWVLCKKMSRPSLASSNPIRQLDLTLAQKSPRSLIKNSQIRQVILMQKKTTGPARSKPPPSQIMARLGTRFLE